MFKEVSAKPAGQNGVEEDFLMIIVGVVSVNG